MKNAFTTAHNDNRDLSYRGGTRGRWCRDNLEAFRSGLGGDRLLADGLALIKLFDAAEKLSTARAALAWARQHGIEFIVDHQTGAGGYYHLGTGVVALSVRALATGNTKRALGTLVHEIRHAWQDYHGLVYTPDDIDVPTSPLGRDLTIEGLFEADAEAHGALVREEYSLANTESSLALLRDLHRDEPTEGRAKLLETFQARALEEKAACENAHETLRDFMLDWYTPHGYHVFYGDDRRRVYASTLGLPTEKSAYVFEYQAPKNVPVGVAPDFHRAEVLQKLGRTFTGGNYLQGLDRDVLHKYLLSPAAAARCFDEDVHAKADAPTQAIRALQLRTQLNRPQKRYPLPG